MRLGLSLATAERYWAYARLWLHADLAGDEGQKEFRKKVGWFEGFRACSSHFGQQPHEERGPEQGLDCGSPIVPLAAYARAAAPNGVGP